MLSNSPRDRTWINPNAALNFFKPETPTVSAAYLTKLPTLPKQKMPPV
jgi:hypothetical protein